MTRAATHYQHRALTAKPCPEPMRLSPAGWLVALILACAAGSCVCNVL